MRPRENRCTDLHGGPFASHRRAGKEASDGQYAFECRRSDMRQSVMRVGRIASCGYDLRNAGPCGQRGEALGYPSNQRKTGWSDEQWRIRALYHDIVEEIGRAHV